MKKPKISIVLYMYRPEKKVYEKRKEMIEKQTLKADEIIENWNMPTAKSINEGIKKAKGEIIVTIGQDCIPEDEFWLERLIKPLENKKVIGVISDLHLPEGYWKRYDFLSRLLTISNLKDRRPGMDMRGCAFRKKEFVETGLLNEDPCMIGIDAEVHTKLLLKGKLAYPNIRVFHLHRIKNSRNTVESIFLYSQGNGQFIKNGGGDFFQNWIRIVRAFPFFGMIYFIYGFPFKKYLRFFPLYLLITIPITHILNIAGFWKGVFVEIKDDKNVIEVKKNTKTC